jgi:transposase
VPDIVSASGDPADWLEAMSGAPLAFKAHDAGAADGIVFRPVYEVQHRRFSVYWRLRHSLTTFGRAGSTRSPACR